MITARGTRSGNDTAHSSARWPPIDPPTTLAQRSMPSVSASAASTTTWSRIVMAGKREPYGTPVTGSIDAGPVVPWQPPSTLGQTTKNRSVSTGLPGPTMSSHQPVCRWPGPAGPATWLSPVSAWSTSTALSCVRVQRSPGLVRDGHGREASAGLEHVTARLEQRRELPVSGRVARSPGAGDRNVGRGRHAPITLRALCGPESRFEVGLDVPDRLDADRQPDQVRGDAGRELLRDVELLVRRGRGVDRERANVADVGEVADEVQAVDEALAGLEPALDAERDDRALALRQVLLRPVVPAARLEARDTRPTRPRRAPRATWRPRARSASGAPSAGSASRGPGERGTR